MRRSLLVSAIVVLAAAASAYVVRGRASPPAANGSGAQAPRAANRSAPADWCTTGYVPIAGGCLALPSPPAPAPLLIYLHGRYAKDQVAEETDRQRRVAARFTSKGYAVLALRGRLGGCGFAELSNWYCWPSNDRTVDSAGDVVGSWKGALDEVDERVRPDRRFVLGFSNGGYFAVLLASRGLVRADAYVIAHAGPVDPVEATSGTPPLLLLSADDDIAQDDMLRLDWALAKGHWPHDSYARAGAHGLSDQDIDAALAFFARSGEPLPLAPPIAGLHRPSHHPHDAGVPSPEASDDEAPPPSAGSDPESSEQETAIEEVGD